MIHKIRIGEYFASKGRRWLVRLLAFTMFLVFLTLFWRMVLSLRFYATDEWSVLSWYASSNDVGDIIRETLRSWNGHFLPLPKLFIFAMYKVFAVEPLPYNFMSILLFAIALMLFYSFTSRAIDDRPAAALATLAMGTTSAYFQVLFWVMLHGHILSMIFLLLALIYAHEGLEQDRTLYFIVGSLASLISALFFTTGLLAAFLAAAYVFLRSLYVKRDTLKAIASKMVILITPMLLFIPIYLSIVVGGIDGSKMNVSPLQSMKLTLFMIGNMVIKEFIPLPMSLTKAIGYFVEINPADIEATNAAIAVVCLAGFFLVALMVVVCYIKASGRLRSTLVFGIVVMVLFAAMHAVGRGTFYENGLQQVIGISRYNFFISVGFFMIMAACIAHYSKRYGNRALYVAAIIVLSLGLLHQSILIKAALIRNNIRSEIYMKTLRIEQKMNTPDSMALLLDSKNPEASDLWKYYSIFRSRDEAVIGSANMVYILKSHTNVGPEDIAVTKGHASVGMRETVIVHAPAELIISSPRPNEIQHLVFRIKSYEASMVRMLCKTGDTLILTHQLEVERHWYYEYHALTCPVGNKIILRFAKGKHKLKDIKLYK